MFIKYRSPSVCLSICSISLTLQFPLRMVCILPLDIITIELVIFAILHQDSRMSRQLRTIHARGYRYGRSMQRRRWKSSMNVRDPEVLEYSFTVVVIYLTGKKCMNRIKIWNDVDGKTTSIHQASYMRMLLNTGRKRRKRRKHASIVCGRT